MAASLDGVPTHSLLSGDQCRPPRVVPGNVQALTGSLLYGLKRVVILRQQSVL